MNIFIKKYGFGLLGLTLVLPALLPVPAYAQTDTAPRIVISEINWSGSVLSTADEWIELANLGQGSVDISGWKIRGAGTSGSTLVIPEDSVIESSTTFLIANYALGDTKTTVGVAPDYATSSISIANSNLSLALMTPTDEIVDSYTHDGSPEFGSISPATSIERNLATLAWHSSAASVHLLDSTQLGSPGIATFAALEHEDDPISEVVVEEVVEPVLEETQENEELEEPTTTLEDTETNEEHISDSNSQDQTMEEIETELVPIVSAEEATEVVAEEGYETEEREGNGETESQISETPKHYAPGSVVINEFLSSPDGTSEWVELLNTTSNEIDLADWILQDASQKKTTLTGTLAAHDFFLIENPSGKLNNSGDSILLSGPDNAAISSLTYGTESFPAPKKGHSAGSCASGWMTNIEPSPRTENICPTPLETSSPSNDNEEETTYETENPGNDIDDAAQDTLGTDQADAAGTSSSELESDTTDSVDISSAHAVEEEKPETRKQKSEGKKKKETGYTKIEIENLESLKTNTLVEVSGIIVATPGTFGKRVAYLDGVQLYFHAADWPEMEAGSLLTIRGTWDVSTTVRRIKIKSVEDITVNDAEEINPASLSAEDAAAAPVDTFVTTSGTIAEKKKEGFVLALSDTTSILIVDSAKIGLAKLLHPNDIVTITGILSHQDGRVVIIPRTKDDIELQTTDEPAAASNTTAITAPPPPKSPVPYVGGSILASGAGALGYWFVKSKKLIPT